jgi:hypothetical protein
MIELRFTDKGPSYERAKAVADKYGLSVRDYLLACIAEGHRVLDQRATLETTDLEIPAFLRRGPSPFAPTDVDAELRRMREIPIRHRSKKEKE